MFSINNLFNNANMQCINQLGQYRVFEHQKDLSVSPYNAETAYFSAEMNVRRRQVLVERTTHPANYRQVPCSGCSEMYPCSPV